MANLIESAMRLRQVAGAAAGAPAGPEARTERPAPAPLGGSVPAALGAFREPPPVPREPIRKEPRPYSAALAQGADRFVAGEERLLDHRIVAWQKGRIETAAFDMLRTKVLNRVLPSRWRSLAVTSPSHGCGKTTVAVNLALSLAHKAEPEPILLDLDLRRPRVARCLGIDPPCDVGDCLAAGAPVYSCIVDAGPVSLRVVPSVTPRANATELLRSAQMTGFLRSLSREPVERLAIVDLPPLLTTDDALALLPSVDCVLLVVAENRTTRAELEEASALLDIERLLGVVSNRSQSGVAPYASYNAR